MKAQVRQTRSLSREYRTIISAVNDVTRGNLYTVLVAEQIIMSSMENAH